jgi:hypothetical protein
MSSAQKTLFNTGFYLHLLVTSLAWIGPFLFDWRLMLLAYALVHLQYFVFKRCVMNASHGLDESMDPDETFYGQLLDLVSIPHNKRRLKRFARGPLYPILGLMAYLWQVVYGVPSLLI